MKDPVLFTFEKPFYTDDDGTIYNKLLFTHYTDGTTALQALDANKIASNAVTLSVNLSPDRNQDADHITIDANNNYATQIAESLIDRGYLIPEPIIHASGFVMYREHRIVMNLIFHDACVINNPNDEY